MFDSAKLQLIKRFIEYEQQKRYRYPIQLCWIIGKLINEERVTTQQTSKVIYYALAEQLEPAYGAFFAATQLQRMCLVYRYFPQWEMLATNLSWSHYLILLRIVDTKARLFYLKAAAKAQWSVHVLERQIKALYYERAIAQRAQSSLLNKQHYIFEFAGEHVDTIAPKERQLETALVDHIYHFLLELGYGFAFVERQKRMVTASGKTVIIDLVFYHFLQQCFVLIELKVGALTHRDIGQMDMYIRLFDEQYRRETIHPTVGLILCTQKDESIERYSVLAENDKLHAATFQLNLPDLQTLAYRLNDVYDEYLQGNLN
ncbi:MAG: PDDEXK nuclease domain-containing protein [Bacteroidota bacterium]